MRSEDIERILQRGPSTAELMARELRVQSHNIYGMLARLVHEGRIVRLARKIIPSYTTEPTTAYALPGKALPQNLRFSNSNPRRMASDPEREDRARPKPRNPTPAPYARGYRWGAGLV
jgi:hypothetical protein